MNFVIKYEKKLKPGPVISSEMFRHVWRIVFEKLETFMNVVLYMGKTDEYKFSICWFSGTAEVLGAMTAPSDPMRWTGSDTALGHTWSATGTGLCRPVQEVRQLMGSGRAGLPCSSGRAALSWKQSSRVGVDPRCDILQLCLGYLPTTTGWMASTPGCTGSTLFLSPKTSGEGWDWNTLKRLPLISF